MIRRRLIVNADGFGFTYGNNRGVFEALEAGFVRSVSVNSNFPAFEETCTLAKRFPRVGIGIHFNLSVGRPVLDPRDVPSLVNDAGEFWYKDLPRRARAGLVDLHEAERELDAQIDRFRRAGIFLTHWDSHRGDHAYPPYLWAAFRSARRAGIRCMRTHHFQWITRRLPPSTVMFWHYLRQPHQVATHLFRRATVLAGHGQGFLSADRAILFEKVPGNGPEHLDTWLHLLDALPEGTFEVWCHPGYPDETLRRYATLVDSRVEETHVLSDVRLVEAAERCGVDLINFRDL